MDTIEIIEELESIAKSKSIPVRKDAYNEESSPGLWNRSCVNWDVHSKRPLRVQIYYTTIEELIIALAHEIGHIETTKIDKYSRRTLYYELKASQWALVYLRKKDSTLAQAAQRRLQVCLNNYAKALRQRPRALTLPQAQADRRQLCLPIEE